MSETTEPNEQISEQVVDAVQEQIDKPTQSVESGEMNSEKAIEVLKREKQEREAKCAQEVNAALEKYGCTISVSMLITQDKNIPQANIVSK